MKPRARFWLLTLAMLIGVAVTLSLGAWQLRRAAQKEALLAAMQASARLPEVDTRALLASKQPLDLVHRSAVLRGRWLGQHTVYLDNRVMAARTGFIVVTPLLLEDSQQAVLVQRGWVARDFTDRLRVPPVPTPEGPVELRGRLALPPSRLLELGAEASAQPANPAQTGSSAIRQNVDHVAFGREMARPLLEVSVQQTDAPSEGLLREWPAPNLGIERHYGYAFQWFSLAALTALLYVWFQLIAPHVRKRSVS